MFAFPDANPAPCRMFQAGKTPANILARKMMSCAPCGPAARAGRVRRESERFTVMEKLLEERQPCWSGNKDMIGSSLPGIQCRDVDLVFLKNNKINYKKKMPLLPSCSLKFISRPEAISLTSWSGLQVSLEIPPFLNNIPHLDWTKASFTRGRLFSCSCSL